MSDIPNPEVKRIVDTAIRAIDKAPNNWSALEIDITPDRAQVLAKQIKTDARRNGSNPAPTTGTIAQSHEPPPAAPKIDAVARNGNASGTKPSRRYEAEPKWDTNDIGCKRGRGAVRAMVDAADVSPNGRRGDDPGPDAAPIRDPAVNKALDAAIIALPATAPSRSRQASCRARCRAWWE